MRKLHHLKSGEKGRFIYSVGENIQLLDNRKESLSELRKEYVIDGSLMVICNTQKLQEMRAVDLFRVARTAGHFGVFCSCGIARAIDIFYLDESLSQCWAFLIKLITDFPTAFALDELIVGYDNACQLKQFCDNQAKRYPKSKVAELIANLRKVHDRLHIRNHHEECRKGELDPDKYRELDGVNTQVAEQFFSHLLNFVCTFRNTSTIRAPLWILLILHNWNLKKEQKLNNTVPS